MPKCNETIPIRLVANVNSIPSYGKKYPFQLTASLIIRTPLGLHQPSLLILLLTPPRPLGCDINPILLLLVTLLLRLMHRPRIMLRRRVHGDQLERIFTGVQKLVLRAGRHDDDVTALDGALFAADLREPGAVREEQRLVDRVHFFADVAVGRNFHGDELAVQPRVQHLPEHAEPSLLAEQVLEHGHLVPRGLVLDAVLLAHTGAGAREAADGGSASRGADWGADGRVFFRGRARAVGGEGDVAGCVDPGSFPREDGRWRACGAAVCGVGGDFEHVRITRDVFVREVVVVVVLVNVGGWVGLRRRIYVWV